MSEKCYVVSEEELEQLTKAAAWDAVLGGEDETGKD